MGVAIGPYGGKRRARWRSGLMQQLGSHITLIALQPGDILQANQLDSQGGLKSEMRAVSVAVNQVTSVGGTVRPGHRVDVFVSYEEELEENKKLPKTMLLLQDVEVLAVFGNVRYFYVPDPVSGEAATYANRSYVGAEESRYTAEGEMMKDTTVTLALSLEDAMKLTYMANFAAEVRLVIRRYDDTTVQSQQPVTVQSHVLEQFVALSRIVAIAHRKLADKAHRVSQAKLSSRHSTRIAFCVTSASGFV